MYRILYGISAWQLCVGLLLLYTVWSYARQKLGGTVLWRVCHGLALLLWLAVSLYITLFSRDIGNGGMNLEPFWSYRIAFAEGSFDYFQEIYLNILAFAGFGLLAPELRKEKWWLIAVMLMAAAFSIGIEYLQYYLDVGLAEFDDVFSNSIGVFLGMLANTISGKYISAITWVRRLWKKS